MDSIVTKNTQTSAPAAQALDNGPDCDRVNTVLDQIIQGQPVLAEDEEYLFDHATDCSPCFDDITKQKAFIGFLNQRVTRRPIPASLQEAIMARVQGEMV